MNNFLNDVKRLGLMKIYEDGYVDGFDESTEPFISTVDDGLVRKDLQSKMVLAFTIVIISFSIDHFSKPLPWKQAESWGYIAFNHGFRGDWKSVVVMAHVRNNWFNNYSSMNRNILPYDDQYESLIPISKALRRRIASIDNLKLSDITSDEWMSMYHELAFYRKEPKGTYSPFAVNMTMRLNYEKIINDDKALFFVRKMMEFNNFIRNEDGRFIKLNGCADIDSSIARLHSGRMPARIIANDFMMDAEYYG